MHLVLARLPDAPPGTRGISLFLVPKFLLNADGSLGERNDVRAHSIEHKLGIHASPTCTMVYGDHGGATGFLVGEENRGLACMFTMMNQARLVGRPAGRRRSPSARRSRRSPMRASASRAAPPAQHRREPDHRASRREAHAAHHARAHARRARHLLCHRGRDRPRAAQPGREAARTAAHERASLLTPVAKAFSTDIGIEVASLGVQVHGGMGYIEETGAAQHFRDARIAAIYEGTNGIQAIDLVTRKLPLSGGGAVKACIGELRRTVDAVNAVNDPAFGCDRRAAGRGGRRLERATQLAARRAGNDPDTALAGATPYLRLFALRPAARCWRRRRWPRAACRDGADAAGRIATARFFAENLAVQRRRPRAHRHRRRRQRQPATPTRATGVKHAMSLKRQDAIHHRRLARHRACDRAARRARRRQHRDRRQDRRAASQAPGTIHTAAEEIAKAGGKALPLAVDVRDEAQVKAAIEQTARTFGGIDIVVNNASAVARTPVAETDMRRFDLMHQINTRGTFMVSKYAIPHLAKAANPHILMISPPLDMQEKWFAAAPATPWPSSA